MTRVNNVYQSIPPTRALHGTLMLKTDTENDNENDNRLEQSLPGAARSVVCHSRNKPYRVREARADLARVTQHSYIPSCIGDTRSSCSILYQNVPKTLSLDFLADLKEITLNISDRREVFDKKVVVYLNFSGHLSQ